MKKFFSVFLSIVLCASIVVTNPPVEIGDEILDPPQSGQYLDDGQVSTCEDDGPGHGTDGV